MTVNTVECRCVVVSEWKNLLVLVGKKFLYWHITPNVLPS